MKQKYFYLIFLLSSIVYSQQIINPVSVTTSFTANFGTDINNTINGQGLSVFPCLDCNHTDTSPTNSFVANEITGTIDFNLGGTYAVGRAAVWNQNDGGPDTNVGINSVNFYASIDGTNYTLIAGSPFVINEVTVTSAPSQIINFGSSVVATHIRMEVLTNHGGLQTGFAEIAFASIPATHLNFDGINDFVVTTNAATNNTENQTFQAWIKIPSLPVTSNRYRIFQRGIDGTGAGWSLALDVVDSGVLQALYVNSSATGNNVNGTTVLSPNTWYHVSMVFENNNSIRVYLNGLLQATLPIGNITLRSSDSKIRIGRGNLSTEYFRGDIDEVRVWNVALSVTDILATRDCELANGETNLRVYYKFNQGFDTANNTSVTIANDSSGNNNNGTLTTFALTGITSNWDAGSAVTTGNTCATLGNSDFNANNTFKVYPNPSKGIFNITSDEALTIEIYDVVGKLVKTVNTEIGNQSIDITSLNSGIYILKTINTNNAKQVFKIIKE